MMFHFSLIHPNITLNKNQLDGAMPLNIDIVYQE